MKQTMKQTIKKAFLSTLPVMAGYMVLGIAFGILLEDKGYSILWAFAMSVLIYAGSMQFVTINLLTGGASLISTAIMTLLVNARHLFYGVAMLDKYKGMGAKKPYLIFGLTDETFALVCNGAPDDCMEGAYYLAVSVFDQCYWVLGSVLGVAIGSLIPFDTGGVDFAMTALFVTIFTEQLLTIPDHIPAIIGVGATLICLIVFGSTSFLIPSMFAIIILLLIYNRFRKEVSA